MIAAWLAYALVVAALVSIAAVIAERIARLRQLPSRGVWICALLLSVGLPLIFGLHGNSSRERARTAIVRLAAPETPPVYAQTPVAWVGGNTATPARRITLDTWLLATWFAMSALAFAALTIGWMQLQRRLRSAVDGEIAGVNVAVTRDIGPAVVGIIRPRIVVPQWLLQQDAATQATVIAHEQEHLRAQDVRVLGGALLLAALLPWNLPLWWQLRGLRFAMEVDCDARVLRAGQSPSSYSAVLLNVATHLVPLRAAAAGLSESGSSLEQRIRIMHTPLRKRWRLLAAALASCSVASIVVAANVTTPPAQSPTSDELPLLPSPLAAQRADEAALIRVVSYFYPQLLQDTQAGRPYVWMVVNPNGEVSQIDMDVKPAWEETEFDSNWQAFLQGHGVDASKLHGQIVMHTPFGKHYVVVAYGVLPGAVARDSAAPTFDVTPRLAKSIAVQLLGTVDAQRRAIELFDPTALSEGVPAGQELWFLIDADGRVQRAGRRGVITDPEVAREAMEKLIPGTRVGYVTRGTSVKDATGKRIPVSWQWLER